MRLVKIIGFSLLGLAALLVLAIVVIVILVDPNDFKAEIAQVVKSHTGRELELEGDLGLSFFPWLALEIRQAQLGNQAGFGEEPFAVIHEADVGVRLWPLVRGELQVGRVRLDGLRVNLAVDENGRSNWEDLGGEQATPETPAPDEGGIQAVTIAGLTVKDSAIVYRDAQADSLTRIDNLNLETGPLTPGQPISVDLAFDYATGEEPASKPWPIALKIPALQLNLEQETLQAPQFTLSLQPAQISGQLSGEQILKAPSFTGRISLAEVSPRDLMKTLGIDPPRTRDTGALSSLALQAAVAATADRVQLSDLQLTLDQSRMKGMLDVADLKTKALRFDLAVDQIDIDRYLEPEAEEKSVKGAPAEPIELPLDLLRSLNARGTLDIGSLTVAGLKLTAVKFKVDAQDGLVRIDPSQAKLYSGSHQGKVIIDARNDPARLTLQEQLQGVEFAPVLQELFDSRRLSGKGNANLDFVATGNDSHAWLKTVDGKLDVSILEGALEGMDLWHEIRRARALFQREAAPAEASTGRTAFKTLKASATVEDGTVQNRDLNVDTDHLKVSGQGKLVLSSLAVDYLLNAQVVQPPEGEAGSQELKALEIPVRITGTLGDLKVRPDLQSRIKAEAQKKIEEKKEELKEKLEDRLKKWMRRED